MAHVGGLLHDLINVPQMSQVTQDTVRQSLRAIRTHLGMDVAYVSEFEGNRSILREVDAPGLEKLVKAGDTYSLDDLYCQHIVAGRLPQLIADTSAVPLAMALPITTALPIGKHVSVPIRLRDGTVYGMYCCLGFGPDSSLRARDLQMMKVFADLTAHTVDRDIEASRAREEKSRRIATIIEQAQFSIAYQPIWKLSNHALAGFEALARISMTPLRSPDKWFAEAAEVGLAKALELAVIRKALSGLTSFPDEAYLAVNVSPETILSGELLEVLAGLPAERLVLEVTEHAQIGDYDLLRQFLRPLRKRGIRLAVDDAGAGYSSLQHILQLRPDIIKLDTCLTRDIDSDPARHALASALVVFATNTGCRIIAEGVETEAELTALRGIGVENAQGYFVGRPVPLDEALRLWSGSVISCPR